MSQKKFYNHIIKLSATKKNGRDFSQGAFYGNSAYIAGLQKIFGKKLGLEISNTILKEYLNDIKNVKKIKLKKN